MQLTNSSALWARCRAGYILHNKTVLMFIAGITLFYQATKRTTPYHTYTTQSQQDQNKMVNTSIEYKTHTHSKRLKILSYEIDFTPHSTC